MENEELDVKIKTLFIALDAKLTKEEKHNTHFRSVANFVYHLIDYPYVNPKKSPKLQEINEVRIKKQLLKYLELIEVRKFTFEESLGINSSFDPYKEVDEIGSFMMQYYSFSNSGGTLKILDVLIFLTVGAVLDVIRFFIMGNPFPAFTIAFFIICLLRIYIKHKQRRVYGVNY